MKPRTCVDRTCVVVCPACDRIWTCVLHRRDSSRRHGDLKNHFVLDVCGPIDSIAANLTVTMPPRLW